MLGSNIGAQHITVMPGPGSPKHSMWFGICTFP